MKLAPTTSEFAPQGRRIGLRQIYFTPRVSPMLVKCKLKRTETAGTLLTALLIVGFEMLVAWLCRDCEVPRDFPGEFLAIALMVWAIADAACLLYGLVFMRVRSLRGWDRPGQIAELTLSGLRPIEIGQFMIYPGIAQFRRFVAIIYIGTIASVFLFLPKPFYELGIPFGFTALNLIFATYLMSWTQLALFLGTDSWLGYILGSLQYTLVYLVCVLPVYIASLFAMIIIDNTIVSEMSIMVVLGTMAPMWLWTWFVQYLFARGWAARIERAIFPRIEF